MGFVKRPPKPKVNNKMKCYTDENGLSLCQPKKLKKGQTIFGHPIGDFDNIIEYMNDLEYRKEYVEKKHQHELHVNATVSNIQNIKSSEQDAVINRLMAQVSSLRREKERCEEALRNRPAEVRVLEQSLADCERDNAMLQNALDDCNSTHARLVEEIDNLITQIDMLERRVKNVEEQQQQSQRELAVLQQKLADADEQLRRSEQEFTVINQQLQQSRQESAVLQQRLAAAEQRLAAAEQEMAAAERTHQSEREELQRTIDDNEMSIFEVSENLAQQMTAAERAQRDSNALKQQLAEAEQVYKSQREQSQLQLGELSQEVADTKRELHESKQHSNALEQQLANILQELEAAERKLYAAEQAHKHEQDELRQRLATTKEQLAETEAERERFVAALDAQNLAYNSLQQIVELEKQLKDTAERAHKSEQDELERQLATTKEQLKDTKEKLNSVTQEHEEAMKKEFERGNDERNVLVNTLISNTMKLKEVLNANKELEAEKQNQSILHEIAMATKEYERIKEEQEEERKFKDLLETHLGFLTQMSKLIEQLTRATEEQRQLQGEINVFRQELKDADEQQGRLQEEINVFQQELKYADEQRQSTTAELQRQNDALREENTDLVGELRSCKENLEGLRDTFANSLLYINDQYETIVKLKQTLNELEKRVKAGMQETESGSKSTGKDWKSKLLGFKEIVEKGLNIYKEKPVPITSLQVPPYIYGHDTLEARAENLLKFI